MNIVAFCLFGDSPTYRVGALRNAELLPRIYPGWQVVCWVDADIPTDLAQRLRERGWQLVTMDGSLRDPRSYRMLAADIPDADVFVVRDIDSRVSAREKAAVDQFLASDQGFHAMRDHPAHRWPVMAGMWGARRGVIDDMAGLLARWDAQHPRVAPMSDQRFLARVVWPLVRDVAMVHDSVGSCGDAAGVVDFPDPREGLAFVGEAYDHEERPRARGRRAFREWIDEASSPPPEAGRVYLCQVRDRRRGMFSVVNDVVDHLYVAEREGFRLLVSWTSCYEQRGMGANAWDYYFERLFDLDEDRVVVSDLLPSHAFRPGNLITPRTGVRLELPRDRGAMKAVIDRHIRLKEPVREKLEAFAARELPPGRPVVGVHIRGPGRNDGGARALRRGLKLQEGVPLELYFRHIDACLDRSAEGRILLCSDAERVVDACARRYGARLILYPATRVADGETHQALGRSKQGYKLGEDVLIEAYLLSRVDCLIHGSSNVTNFALCNAPSMEHLYVYE